MRSIPTLPSSSVLKFVVVRTQVGDDDDEKFYVVPYACIDCKPFIVKRPLLPSRFPG